MSDIAIRAENLGKLYRIGQRQRYKILRDTLTDAMYAPFRMVASMFNGRRSAIGGKPSNNFIWALEDVSFEVKHGKVVGIIGRNGSGKSTLLKILSRITEPTRGYAEIYGRVGSLLEVGTGFHPELTGRENIYLNGAILGMSKSEIERKFDEIVDFAEVEKFLDMPIKRYSSGMYVRLAFAVAAHLEPEILLVDEVLAVGDIAFQKKCLGRMGDVAKAGRTVLFVSHQMNSIRKMCERCIWLDAGHIQMEDTTVKVVNAYEAALTVMPLDSMRRADDAHIPARFLSWEIVEPKTKQTNLLTTLGPVTFKTVIKTNKTVRDGTHGIALWDNEHRLIWGTAIYKLRLDPGIHEFTYSLATIPLRPGIYHWLVSLYSEGEPFDIWDCVPELVIGTEPMTHPRDEWAGILNVPCEFRINHLG